MNSCPVCLSNDTFLYMKGIFDSDSTSVIECRNCGLQFLDPMMSDEEENEYYRNYYENQKTRHHINVNLIDISNRAFNHYEQYSEVYYNLIKDANRILEIGSGSGGFIRYIKKHFKDKVICSVEKSEANLAFLNDRNINDFSDVRFFDDLDSLDIAGFDLIVAFGVLEHIKRSETFINSLRRLLLDAESKIAFSIPHPDNPLVCIYQIEEFRKFIYMKQHHYTFTEKSLRILGEKTGLIVDYFAYMQVWSLDNHLSWLIHKKPKDFSFFTNLLSKETLDDYNSDLIKRKATDIMMVVYKTAK